MSAWGDSWGSCAPLGQCEINEYTCGTGDWTGPKPGDPDNNIVLSAVAKAGGIEVSFSYPLVNPHAVAHTRLFRGTSANFSSATQRAVVDGNYFFDKIEGSGTTYYYWIQIVSIHGTVGDPVGPASATLTGELAHLKDLLYGEIDEGVLAQALKGEIANITTLGQDLLQEIQDRIAAGDLLGVLFEQVSSDVSTAFTFIEDRLDTLVTADSALIQQYQLLAAMVNQNGALILSERNIRIDEDEILANTMEYLYAQSENNMQAAVLAEKNARITADSTLANQITTTQTTLNGNIASVQTSLQSNINTVNGKVTQIGALYTAKVDVNGLVGGFGIYNDGSFVDAGFDVDRFWVGRTNGNKVKPFVIQNDIVYINKAQIRDADIDTLKIGNGAVTSMAFGRGAYGTLTAGQRGVIVASASVFLPAGASGAVISLTGTVGTLGGGVEVSAICRVTRAGGHPNHVAIVGGEPWVEAVGHSFASQTAWGFSECMACTAFDATPLVGWNTYHFVFDNLSGVPAGGSGDFNFSNAAIIVTGGKR